MKKVMNLKSLLFCAMLVLTMAFNTVNVQAGALDYLGNTIDGSELTNEDGIQSEIIKVWQEVHIFIRGL